MNIPAYVDVAKIKASYAPYHQYPAFEFGYESYIRGYSLVNPKSLSAINQQAFDRGYEAGMKVMAAARWVETNVGSN